MGRPHTTISSPYTGTKSFSCLSSRLRSHHCLSSSSCTEWQTPFRIERLWRDVYMAVTNLFYSVLHTLEDGGYLDLSNELHLFSCHCVFIPRLQASVDVFRDGWDNHPLKSEQNLTPNQMWEMGQMQSPIPDPVFNELHIPDIEWESSGLTADYSSGISIPVIESPLDEQEMDHLKRSAEPIAPSSCHGMDVYLATVECVQRIINSR